MSLSTGQQALIRRIVTMDGAPNIRLPNGPGADLPRYVVQVSGGSQSGFGVDGSTEARPEIVVRVETISDTYATESDALVSALVDRFSPGDTFDGIEITSAPLPRAPIEGNGIYAVPVIISGRFIF